MILTMASTMVLTGCSKNKSHEGHEHSEHEAETKEEKAKEPKEEKQGSLDNQDNSFAENSYGMESDEDRSSEPEDMVENRSGMDMWDTANSRSY